MALTFSEIAKAIAATGLDARGGFPSISGDDVPPRRDGRKVRTVVLAGNLGGGFWSRFAVSPERDLEINPLDAWTRRVLGEVAAGLGAEIIFPFEGPPFHPFQRWALRAETLSVSPLGLLIHPEWGLWHAFRGALLFAEAIALPAIDAVASSCSSCVGRPCLASCPVGAFTGDEFRVGACVSHISKPTGSGCRQLGCLARRACPVGADRAYSAEQQQFHMASFLRARSAP